MTNSNIYWSYKDEQNHSKTENEENEMHFQDFIQQLTFSAPNIPIALPSLEKYFTM